ncbi:MAG: NAD-dependent epimerase/dehydratase family protein [Actinobacteria bacterium]|nr:NAD-dependent epimerase/dehydratase family protein [Actinomycetota bacterium]
MQHDLHTVLGATGGAGNAIARALADDGHRVRAVSRRGDADLPAGIERLAADITTPEGAAAAVDGASVVVMAAQPPYHRWPQEFPAMLGRVIDAAADAGARLVMVDNLYAYGRGEGPITERTPERATDRKGLLRRDLTRMLLDAHRSGRLRVAIGRASDYFGPRADNGAITALAIAPAAAGKGAKWVGGLDAPHSVAYLPDVARAYARLCTSPEAYGEVWVLPHGEPVTGREFLDAVNRALPEPVGTGLLPTAMLRIAAPFHKPSREMLGVMYQWTEPFVADDTAFQTAFGPLETTPLDEAVQAAVDWYRGG